MLYFIYELIDPRTDEIPYVGITNDPNIRLRGHLVRSTTNERKSSWVEALARTGMEPKMKIIEIVESRAEAEERESHWIMHYTTQGVKLTNVQKNPQKKKEGRTSHYNPFEPDQEGVNEPVDVSAIYEGALQEARRWRTFLDEAESRINSNDLEALCNWIEQEDPDLYKALKGQTKEPLKGWIEGPAGESIMLD